MDRNADCTRWASHDWRTLPCTDLDALAVALDDPEIHRWLDRASSLSLAAKLECRLARERAGESLHLVPHDQSGPVGFVALLPYPGAPGSLQSSVYLSRRARGGSLYGACVSVLWALAHDLLGHDVLVASSHVDNRRSQGARRKVAPAVEPRLVWEPWWPRPAMVFELTEPPGGVEAPDPEALAAFARLALGLPGYSSLSRRAAVVAAA